MKINKAAAALVCASAAAASAAVFADGFRYVFCRHYTPLAGRILDSKGHSEEYYVWRDSMTRYMSTRRCEEHEIVSSSGSRLRGYYYTAGDAPSSTVVFLIHGYRAEHNEACAPFYDYYMSRGIDIFTCDHAAHGSSEGELIGFGVTEARDCLSWIDYLLTVRGKGIKIILHGFSMGAAAVMLMSDRCPENVRFIVEDSGFTSAGELLGKQLGTLYGPYTKINRFLSGTNMEASDVRPHLARTDIPVLFVHGKLDRFVPFEMAPELYKVCASAGKDRLYIDNARHVESMYCAPREYKAALDSYLRRYAV